MRERRRVEQERARLQSTERLKEEMVAFERQRREELKRQEEETMAELRHAESEQLEQVRETRRRAREAEPEKRVERAAQELVSVRRRREELSERQQQVRALDNINETINRRLFSGQLARPRKWVEVIALFPDQPVVIAGRARQSIHDYAWDQPLPQRDNVDIDPKEDLLTVAEQFAYISTILCGGPGPDDPRGYAQTVLRMRPQDCRLQQ